MSFEAGYIPDGVPRRSPDGISNAGLVAICDGCGTLTAASRNENGECIVPAGWQRVSRKQIGTLHCIPVYRSRLLCPECQN